MPDRALETARQVLEIAPKDLVTRLIMTSAHVRSKHPDLARETAIEVKELDPSFSVRRFAESQYYRDREFLQRYAADLLTAGLPD
jgi:hypothetical protein